MMPFDTMSSPVATTINRMQFVMDYHINTFASEFHKTLNPVNQQIDLFVADYPIQSCSLHDLEISDSSQNIFVENTDYTIDYTNKTVTPIDSGAMQPDTDYHFNYHYSLKEATFMINVLDQNGNQMRQYEGNLLTHLTTQQQDNVIQLLDLLRTKAEAEVLT